MVQHRTRAEMGRIREAIVESEHGSATQSSGLTGPRQYPSPPMDCMAQSATCAERARTGPAHVTAPGAASKHSKRACLPTGAAKSLAASEPMLGT